MTPRRSSVFVLASPTSYHFCKLLLTTCCKIKESSCILLTRDRVAAEHIDYPSALSNWSNSPFWTACHGQAWKKKCTNRNCSQLHYSATYIVFKVSCQWVGIIPICTTKSLQWSVWWLLVRYLNVCAPKSWQRHSTSFLNRWMCPLLSGWVLAGLCSDADNIAQGQREEFMTVR